MSADLGKVGPEIEITPEMIEAGVEALAGYGPEGDSAEATALAIFCAMMRVARTQQKKRFK